MTETQLTNREKVQQWLDKEREKGLIDCNFTANQDKLNIIMSEKAYDEVEEILIAEILDMIEASEDPTRCTEITKL